MMGFTRWCAFFVANTAWQTLLLAGVVALLVRSFRGMGARLQYRLWVGSLVLSVVLPMASTYLALAPVRTTTSIAAGEQDRWTTPRPPEHGRLRLRFTEIPGTHSDWNLFAVITTAFGICLLFRAGRLARQLKRTQQVVRQSKSLPWRGAALETTRLSLRLGVRSVGVFVCPELSVPVTVSWWRPVVLLPPVYEDMPEIEQVFSLAHELAHVRRRDFEVNLLLELISLGVCFHPAAYWIKKRIAECREEACDEMAAEVTGERTQYARFLLHVAQRAEEHVRAGLALGISNTSLERRILALLNPVRKTPRYASMVSILSTTVLLGISVAAVRFSLHPTSVQAGGMPAFAFDPSQTFDTLKPQAERKQAPDFSLVDNNGKTITLSSYRGKVVLLDFWATWCGGCKLEIPWYMEFDRKYRKDGLAVIGVSMDEKGWAAVRPFLAEKRDAETGGMIAIRYPIVIGSDAMAQRFGLKSMPMTLLIDKEGKVAVSHTGVVDRDNFESNVRALLK